jgi:tRNA(Ile)-lysidine synthase TilS/MesJ
VREHHLDGVILAHHADDQAETVFHRLLRGSGYAGLCGMSPDSSVRGVRVLRPLLGVRASWLREYLRERTLTWREDSSNRCGKYLRNRIRQLLHEREDLHGPLIDLAEKCRALRNWVRENAPRLDDPFEARQLADLSELLARESAGRWLRARGVPSDELSPAVAERLLTMCEDAASPPRVQFPGGVTVRRRAGRISAEPS